MEVAGLVIGAISLSGLLDSVLTNLERIRIGKNFGENYESCILQLEVLKLRLNRWRDAVTRLSEAGGGLVAIEQADGELAKKLLKLIEGLLQQERRLSAKYTETNTRDDSLEDGSRNERNSLVTSLRGISGRHRRNHEPPSAASISEPTINTNTTFGSKVRWAITGQKRFEELVKKISENVGGLEQIVSTDEMAEQLRKMRVEDAREVVMQPEANERDVELLREVSLVIDQKFAETVEAKATREWVGNVTEDRARIMQGDVVSDDYRGATITPSGSWRKNVARGESRITQGTVYGYNPFD